MAILDIVLGNLALIDLALLGKKIDRVSLLQERLALVFLVLCEKYL